MVPGSVPTTPDVGGRADSSARHAARDDGGGAVLALDDHHRRVEARDLHRGVEHAIHELLEVDRASELAEEPVPAALLLGALERARELAGRARPSCSASRRPRGRAPALGSRGRLPTAQDDRNDDGRGHEGRGDDHDRRRHAVSQLIRTYSPCTHANGGCNLERGTPIALYCPNWTMRRGPSALLSQRVSGGPGTATTTVPGPGLLRLPERVLGAPERGLRAVALDELGDAGGERDPGQRRRRRPAVQAAERAPRRRPRSPPRGRGRTRSRPGGARYPLPTLSERRRATFAERGVRRLRGRASESSSSPSTSSATKASERPKGRASRISRATASSTSRRSASVGLDEMGLHRGAAAVAAARDGPRLRRVPACARRSAAGQRRLGARLERLDRLARAATRRAPPRSSAGATRARASPLREGAR